MKRTSFTLSASIAAVVHLLFPAGAHAALITYRPLDNATGIALNNGAAITSGSQGKFGEAASFDGINDWANVTAGNPVTGNVMRTVSVWVSQTAGATLLRTPVGLGGNVNGTKWDIDIDNANGGIEVGIGNGRTVDSGLTGLTGSWSLIVTTLPVAAGTVQDIDTYFNGSPTSNTTIQTQAVSTSATNPLAGTSFRLGTSANNNVGNTAPNIQFFAGLVDDVAVWDEALTAGEIKGLFDVGSVVALSYTAGQFDLLKQRHDLATGSTTIGSLEWTYTTGLAGPAGLTGGPGAWTLVLDATNGTGLVVVPEPHLISLIGACGGLLLLRRRK